MQMLLFFVHQQFIIKRPCNYSCAKHLKNKKDIDNFIFQKNQFKMNFVRADLFANVIYKIAMKLNNV